MPNSDREQLAVYSLLSSDVRPSDSSAYIRLAHVAEEALFQGKWQVQILCSMRSGSVRIGQLGRLIPGASKKVLTQSLRRLEFQGIVVRRNLSDLILHVEYELHHEVRESIGELLDQLSQWGADFVSLQGKKGQLNGRR
jgi:DNA-binding HxlR family transcriptional regulator